jgi:hypothetical protein
VEWDETQTQHTTSTWLNGNPVNVATNVSVTTGGAKSMKMNRYQNNGNCDWGEIIFLENPTQEESDKVEGYLAHKWALEGSLPSTHPYRTTEPVDANALLVNGWTPVVGVWDYNEIANGVIKGLGGGVTSRQDITTIIGEIYEVFIDRSDTEEGLIIKLGTSANVEWLSHLNDVTNVVDVLHGDIARFRVLTEAVTYIEINTNQVELSFTSVSLKRKKLAGGVITELTNNTIKKTSGGDAWNAGTSSTEFINGQGEGYVQFQMAQSGKDIKIGLTNDDLDYDSITPFQLYFTGTTAYAGSYYCPYITGDWFRIQHDSVNNQILFKKRGVN